MTLTVTINDDFNLEKICESGQIFRMKKDAKCSKRPVYTLISGNSILKISKLENNKYSLSCSENEFKKTWHPFFNLERNYAQIRNELAGKNEFIDMCLDYGRGLRILTQDPWEMIITFIISQRKSMPAIATCIEALCTSFGNKISINEEQESFYAFPSAEKISMLSEKELLQCGLGYRAEYVLDAARKVSSGWLSIEECKNLPDEKLFSKLCEVRGIGPKVANCIMLFGFGRTSCAPIDVWISRIIEEEFAGKNPFPAFGSYAGIVQQYMFFWKTQHKK